MTKTSSTLPFQTDERAVYYLTTSGFKRNSSKQWERDDGHQMVRATIQQTGLRGVIVVQAVFKRGGEDG